jgi:hypothetical protein
MLNNIRRIGYSQVRVVRQPGYGPKHSISAFQPTKLSSFIRFLEFCQKPLDSLPRSP